MPSACQHKTQASMGFYKTRTLLPIFHKSTLYLIASQPCRKMYSCHLLLMNNQQTCKRFSNLQSTTKAHGLDATLMVIRKRCLSKHVSSALYCTAFKRHGRGDYVVSSREMGGWTKDQSDKLSGWTKDQSDKMGGWTKDQSDKLQMDFDEESDLQQLLEDCMKLLDTDNFKGMMKTQKSVGPATDLTGKMQDLVKYLCLCQCSPDNILQFMQSNPQILTPSGPSLQKVILYLQEIGLRRGQLLKALDGHKTLWGSSMDALRKRLRLLQTLGFGNDLRKVAANWPQILTVPVRRLNQVVEELKKCDFSKEEIRTMLADYPQVLKGSPEDLG